MGDRRKTHKKFQRLPVGERPGIQIMPADEELMLHIYRHRLIEADALYSLFPDRSEQTISRRLHKLYHNEYIDRPLAQRGGNELEPGSSHLAYAIDTLGARQVQKHLAFDIAPQRWRQKNAELTILGADHVLDITKYVAGLAAATRAYDGVSLRYVDELVPSEILQKRRRGLFGTLRATVSWTPHGDKEGTAPDAIIALDGKDRQIFLVEIDRGTETIEPSKRKQTSSGFWRDTSILRKFLIYAAAFRARAHQAQLGLPVFRVLTVTTQPGRVGLMQETYKRHLSEGPNRVSGGLFLFTDWGTLSTSQDYLSASYQTASGRSVSLLDK